MVLKHSSQRKKEPVEKRPVRPKAVLHDETPSMITDHKFAPMGEWWTRCKYCRLSEAAHAESEFQYMGESDDS